MIKNKKELKFYIEADRIMNGRAQKKSFKALINRVLMGGV